MRKNHFSFMILLFLTTLLLCGTIVSAEPSVGGSGTGGNAGSATIRIVGGPTSDKTGWLMYIIDGQGNQISDTKIFYSTNQRPGSNYIFYPKTRFGGIVC